MSEKEKLNEIFAKPVKCHSERSEESFYVIGYQHYKIFRGIYPDTVGTQNDS